MLPVPAIPEEASIKAVIKLIITFEDTIYPLVSDTAVQTRLI